jgi:diguanylate cyclase (GGDEF)-like protein/PAS domain S-box-containing protein
MADKDLQNEGGQFIVARIVGCYVVVAALWILFSDLLLLNLVPDPVIFGRLSVVKGWLFVAITSGLLFYLIRRGIASIRRNQQALIRSENRFRMLIEQAPEAILVLDADQNRFVMANSRAERLFGCSRAELMRPVMVIDRAAGDNAVPPICSHLLREQVVRAGSVAAPPVELAFSVAGQDICCEMSVVKLADEDRNLLRASFLDISERKAAQARIEFLAYHDVLTGLPNRLLACDRLELAMRHADRTQDKVGLLFLDLDNFKAINDSLGHPVGDALLKAFAARLRECLRESDTLSRQGGDEFLIVLPDLHAGQALQVTASKILERMAADFEIDGVILNSTVSIGIAVYPDNGGDAATLLKMADTAMYHAKEAGRNAFRFYAEQMNLDAIEGLTIRNGLRQALECNQFVLHYQPQFDLSSGAVVGAEALIRWNHPEMGLLYPGRFISIAEDSGLIVPIGDWVLREACRQAVAGRQAGLPPLLMAVNLSAVQFKRSDLEQSVAAALADSGHDPACLELELTESILIQDTENVLATVQRLKSLGIKLSIDDFGTGYSSLSYLKRFAVDKLKIDQSFVRDMVTDPNDAAIVGAIIQMARSLNLKTIAEGVEDERTMSCLQLQHCDEAQGYHFSRPIPADEFARFHGQRQRIAA